MLFGKKKDSMRPGLLVVGNGGEVLYHGVLMDLPIPEAVVLYWSVRLFNDPAPCMIHRGAVLSRIHLRLLELLDGGKETATETLPEDVRDALGQYPDAYLIRLTEVRR